MSFTHLICLAFVLQCSTAVTAAELRPNEPIEVKVETATLTFSDGQTAPRGKSQLLLMLSRDGTRIKCLDYSGLCTIPVESVQPMQFPFDEKDFKDWLPELEKALATATESGDTRGILDSTFTLMLLERARLQHIVKTEPGNKAKQREVQGKIFIRTQSLSWKMYVNQQYDAAAYLMKQSADLAAEVEGADYFSVARNREATKLFESLHALSSDNRAVYLKAVVAEVKARKLLKAGNIPGALEEAELALKLKNRLLGDGSPQVAEMQLLIAQIYDAEGIHFKRALDALKKAAAVCDESYVASSIEICELAARYQLELDELSAAFKYVQQAKSDQSKRGGDKTVTTARLLLLEGDIMMRSNQGLASLSYQAAVRLLLELHEQNPQGDEDARKLGMTALPRAAISWMEYAVFATDDSDQYRASSLRQLKIALKWGVPLFGEKSSEVSQIYEALGYYYYLVGDHQAAVDHYRRARGLREALPVNKQSRLTNPFYEVVSLIRIGKTSEALDLTDTVVRDNVKLARRYLKGFSHRDRMQYVKALQISEYVGGLAMLTKNRPGVSSRAAEWQFNCKGLASEAIAGFAGDQQWVSLQKLRDLLPVDAVYIDIARVTRVQPEKAESFPRFGDHYVAWVIPGDQHKEVKLIDLGDASEIDTQILSFRKDMQQGKDNVADVGIADAFKLIGKSLHPLSNSIFSPLEPELTGASRVVLSPDADLWLVPWEAMLQSNGKFAVEQFEISYVTSARDLLPGSTAGHSAGGLLLANPDFGKPQSGTRRAATGSNGDGPLVSIDVPLNWAPLSKTLEEANSILPQVKSYLQESPTVLLGGQAQESAVKTFASPRVLVFATHAYYSEGSLAAQTPRNPLVRCGLVLAGANVLPTGNNDGILTGLEISALPLSGTELVVLSACDTGVGETSSGSGVAGIRQAFQLAGARCVVSSLWSVSDQLASNLSAGFWRHFALNGSGVTALRSAQLEVIQADRDKFGVAHPYNWALFTVNETAAFKAKVVSPPLADDSARNQTEIDTTSEVSRLRQLLRQPK